jgi:hypothetical protein
LNRSAALRRSATVFALAATALAGLVATLTLSAPAASGSVQTPAVGVQFHATWSSYTDAQRIEVLDKMAAAGVKWVRIDLGWASMQDTRGVYSQWYVDLVDRTVDAARARGIHVLGMFWMTPGWANGGAGAIAPPTSSADYATALGWAAKHWQGRIDAWEIWNEPNTTGFWTGTTAEYVQLLKAAYPAVKANDPGALVVLGGPSENDTSWLSAAYAAGMRGSFDVMSTHPYMGMADAAPEQPDDGSIWTISHVGAVHNLMVANGDGSKPIWFTEFGWSSHDNWAGVENWNRGVTAQQQADYFVRAVKYVAGNYPYVTNVFWYEERNNASGNVQLDNYGLLNRDLTPKPAYTAIKTYLGGAATTTTTTAATTTTTTAATTTTTTTTTSTPAPPTSANLLVNGNFEAGLNPWGSWQGAVSLASDGNSGAKAAKVARTAGAAFSIYSWPRPVLSTTAGVAYRGQGFVRTDSPKRRVCLYVREWSPAGAIVGMQSSCVTTSRAWQAFPPVSYKTAQSGGSLELFVMQPSGAGSGDSFEVDGLTLTR